MATQLESARAGIITEEMKKAVENEPVSPEELRDLIAAGLAVLPKNVNHSFPDMKAIGKGLKTKVNANLGTSGECCSLDFEREKLDAAIRAKTDSIMDLSTGGELSEFRKFFLDNSPVIVGSVPIYGVASEMMQRHQALDTMDGEELLRSIERQCSEGLDYITVHCGVTLESVKKLEVYERIMPCVSRGGSIHMAWMRKNGKQNPLYEYYDDLLSIAYKYDVTLSLGDGFRPGAILDATDGAQLEELMILGELARRARKRNVQVMIEGPGHVPLNQITANVMLQKKLVRRGPFLYPGAASDRHCRRLRPHYRRHRGRDCRGRRSRLSLLCNPGGTPGAAQCRRRAPGSYGRTDCRPYSGYRERTSWGHRGGPAHVDRAARPGLGRDGT